MGQDVVARVVDCETVPDPTEEALRGPQPDEGLAAALWLAGRKWDEDWVAGQPSPPRLLYHYTDASGQFFAGLWAGTRGAWRVHYREHEFCHLLAGRIALVSDAGARCEFVAGDSFVIPAGFSGTWEVLEDCRKLYAIFESAR